MIRKAVILAAGFGTRMKDLTRSKPKPLLPVFGKPMIEWQILLLHSVGVREIGINVHYLGNQIMSHLQDGEKWNVKIHYSIEPEIMGTGGAYLGFRDFLDEPFIALNSDVFVFCNYMDFIHEFESNDWVASMALLTNKPINGYTPVYFRKQQLIQIGGDPCEECQAGIFTGLQILSPAIFDYLPDGPSSVIRNFYAPALEQGKRIGVFTQLDQWIDIGTKEAYEDFTGNPQNIKWFQNIWEE